MELSLNAGSEEWLKWEELAWVRHCSTWEELDKFKCLEAKCREKPWKSGLEPMAPNRLADRKHCALSTQPNPHLQKIDGRLESLRLKFTNEPSIFCRWGFGWVDKAQCFRSARRFGAVGSSPDFSGFSRHLASRHLNLSSSSQIN